MHTTPSQKHAWLHLVILAAVALAMGAYLIATAVTIAGDGVFYIRLAQGMATDPHGVAQRYPIGYPALLWVAHEAAGLFAQDDSPEAWARSSQVVTLLCRAGALVFVYLLGRSLVGARRSFLAVLILIFLPHPARYGVDVLREWPFLMLLSLGVWLLVKAVQGRTWRLFGCVGLASGVGYLIRPMSGQLGIYGVVALLAAWLTRERRAKRSLMGAGLFLLFGFALPVAPYLAWSGSALPHQFRPSLLDAAPVIATVENRSASHEPLRFDVRIDESLEIAIDAFDPDGDPLVFSVVAIPAGTRPVYRLRSAEFRADFWTISENEKERLITSRSRVWDYQGIDYYAYPQRVANGLAPVFRFWSPDLNRHFYASSRDAGPVTSSERWRSEGAVFYAWTEASAPDDAVSTHRFRGPGGLHYWSLSGDAEGIERLAGGATEAEGPVWYAHQAGRAPAGLTVEKGVLRWRPASDQQGEHQLNVIVTDGELESCQLLSIDVRETGSAAEADEEGAPVEGPPDESAEVGPAEDGMPAPISPVGSDVERPTGSLLGGIHAVLDGVASNLMGFFLLPLCVGLAYRLRYEADWQERVLMIAAIAVNVTVMLGRFLWVEPTSARRYSTGLVVLCIAYIPVGLERMAHWLRVAADRVFGDHGRAEHGERVWFYSLLIVGIVICLPELLEPLHAEKAGCRDVAAWLRTHTQADAVIAVPDERISFYADRIGRVYRNLADPRTVDYVVVEARGDESDHHPAGWERRYSCWISEVRGTRWIVYEPR